jgi:arylsulfatase I/J
MGCQLALAICCNLANVYTANRGALSQFRSRPPQGGIRGAAFVSGGFLPEKVRGTRLADPMHLVDHYTTFAFLAGVEDPTDAPAAAAGLPALDGVNFWPRLSGEHRGSGQGQPQLYGAGQFRNRARYFR